MRKDGNIRWVWERGSPIYNEQGEVEAIEGFIQDITKRRQSENAAIKAEERYRSIFENAIEGIYQTTPNGEYLNLNPALARIYGYDSSEHMQQKITDIQHQLYIEPGRRAEFIAIMEAQGSVQNFEAQVCRKNGEVIWISENAREVRDADGKLLIYEGTVEDITERKNYQRQIEYQATQDILTGLPNRTLLADRLQQSINYAGRYDKGILHQSLCPWSTAPSCSSGITRGRIRDKTGTLSNNYEKISTTSMPKKMYFLYLIAETKPPQSL